MSKKKKINQKVEKESEYFYKGFVILSFCFVIIFGVLNNLTNDVKDTDAISKENTELRQENKELKENIDLKKENENLKGLNKWNDNSKEYIKDFKFNHKMQNGTDGEIIYSYIADDYMILVEQKDDSALINNLKVSVCVMKNKKCDAKDIIKDTKIKTIDRSDIDDYLSNVNNVKALLDDAL